MTSSEVWMPIPGYPYYQASSLGRIRSLTRWVPNRGQYVVKRGKVLKPRHNTTDRLQVTIYKDFEQGFRSVHSLVCEAFHGPRPNDRPLALHRDGNHLNNRPDNLYWGTPKENAQDALRHGVNFQANQTHCTRGHEKTDENMYVRPDGKGRFCLRCAEVRTREQAEKRKLQKALAGAYEQEGLE